MAADIKILIDESVKHHGELNGKVGGAFASSGGLGGGNETTVLDIVKALLVHGMVIKGDPQGDHYGPIALECADPLKAVAPGTRPVDGAGGNSIANHGWAPFPDSASRTGGNSPADDDPLRGRFTCGPTSPGSIAFRSREQLPS